MKKWIVALFLVMGVFFLLPENGNAAANHVIQVTLKANDKTASSDNVKKWNQMMEEASANKGEINQVTIPAGTYYFDSTLLIPSNVTLSGKGAAESKFVFTKAVTGVSGIIKNKTPGAGIQLENVTIKDLTLTYDTTGKSDGANIIQFSPGFDEENRANYKLIKNIRLENLIVDAKEIGSSTISLSRVQTAQVVNNQVKNSGKQNGIALEFTSGATISGNVVTNSGKSGIQLYRFNGGPNAIDKIIVSNNVVTDWMQRFGFYSYERAYQTDPNTENYIMADSGIDSYGPENTNLLISGNVLKAGTPGQELPDNTKLREKYGAARFPENMLLLNAIRLTGATNVVVENNQVSLNGKDILAFMSSNQRIRGEYTTKPSNILVRNNQFSGDGVIRYPIRLFEVQVGSGRGIEFTGNGFHFSQGSTIANYYKAVAEVRGTSQKLAFSNNIITSKEGKVKFLVSVNGTGITLKELVTTNNLLNGKTFSAARGTYSRVPTISAPIYKTGTKTLSGIFESPVAKVRLWKNGKVLSQAQTNGNVFVFSNAST
ncbi:hypothetical protein MFLO_01815 [Listeria floridensis FSL S10-1187]|uniref:Right handed beta helix domain-containing protein n=1 Tax=Listeria floridensis FSL S10-1187 TaxID=1265817 RepID=A0ABN0RJ45_9LIST|nr:right-handed parallel beta-helix repeat-containing protein [Listeria floridensis]EUJ33917.1 hypothetical protein MFLO_01815 [Listeria floridensis FSL S10-1187]